MSMVPDVALKAALRELRHISGLSAVDVERAIAAAWFSFPARVTDPRRDDGQRKRGKGPVRTTLLRSLMAGTRLGGITEVALQQGASRQQVGNWLARRPDPPEPVLELAATPVYDLDEMARWCARFEPVTCAEGGD